jgi:hypothetical protein
VWGEEGPKEGGWGGQKDEKVKTGHMQMLLLATDSPHEGACSGMRLSHPLHDLGYERKSSQEILSVASCGPYKHGTTLGSELRFVSGIRFGGQEQ